MKNFAVSQIKPVVILLPKTTINSNCMIDCVKRNLNKYRLKRKRNDKKIYITTIQ